MKYITLTTCHKACCVTSIHRLSPSFAVNAVVITIPYSDMMSFTNIHVNAGQIVHEPLKKV